MSKINSTKLTPKMMTRTRKASQQSVTPTTRNVTTPFSKQDEVTLANMIRNIVKEELESHKEGLQEFISSKLLVTNERLNELSKEVKDITESLEFTQKQVEEDTKAIKKDIERLKKNVGEIERDLLDPEDVSKKLIELEDRSRRNNLRIDGIQESDDESWEKCEEDLQNIIKDKLDIDKEIEIDRCHRAGKKQYNRPRTIVCRITNFKDKQLILKNAKKLKNTGIYIYEDFCRDTMELRKQLWEDVLEYRRQNKFAYLNYRSIVVKDHVR